MKTHVLAALVAGTFGHLAAVAAEPARPAPAPVAVSSRPAAAPAAGTALAALKPGQRVEIKIDTDRLFALKRNDLVKLPLGSMGELPLVFDSATKVVNNVAYWEAHLDGDLAQRVSLRIQDKQLSGAIYLRDRKLTIETTNGRSFLVSPGSAEQTARLPASAPRVFASVPAAAATEALGYPGEAAPSASWPVAFNAEQLKATPLNSEVALDLPDGRSLAIVHDKAELGPNGSYTFIGYVREHGTDHRVVITTGADGSAYGVLNLREGEVRVESRLGRQWLVDVKKSGITYAPMSEPLVPPGPADMPATQALGAQKAGTAAQTGTATAATAQAAGEATVVDLMVLYSPGMVSRLGSDAAARTRIDNLVAITNQSLVDSDVQIKMRLVHTMAVNQADNVNQGTLLGELQGGRGAFSGVAAARDQYGADLVEFVHKPTAGVGSCGIAYLSVTGGPRGNQGAGFSVIDDSCPTMVMPHELGHNFGNNHDHAQGGGNPVYPYSWGYIVPGTNYGDIMSYAGTHYYKFSNPRIGGCNGQACGQVNYADTAQSMNNIRQIVAGYRPTKVGGGDPPTPPTTGRTCFYEHINYGGQSLCVDSGSFNLPASWDNIVSSVKVKPGASITLFQGTNLGGRSLSLSTDEPNLVARNFNDVTTSFTFTETLRGRFMLQAAHSGKCVDLYAGNAGDGAPLVQWPCNGGDNQLFDVSQSGSDSNGPIYRLTIARTGKVVDVSSASRENGAKVWQWPANGTGAQQFYLRRINTTDYVVTNRNSGKVLDIQGGSLADTTALHQWDYVGGGNQHFRLAPVVRAVPAR